MLRLQNPTISLSILDSISTLSQWEINLFSEKILLNQSDLDLASFTSDIWSH